MDPTPANLGNLFLQFDIKFNDVYRDGTPLVWSKVATEMPSATDTNVYDWLSKLPRMREWVGPRVAQSLAAYSYQLKNKDWESTLEVERNRIEDDQYGIYTSQYIPQMAVEAKKQPDYMIVDAMRTGQSVTIYDGQNFFDAAHPVNKFGGSGATQSNYFTSTALNVANLYAVIAAMQGYLGEDNNPLGVNPTTLVVPPALGLTARTILNSSTIAPATLGTGGTNVGVVDNQLRGILNLEVWPELAPDPTVWYVLDTSRIVKPFIFQNRRAVQFQQLTAANDENVFNRKKYVFGADMRGAAGYALWFLAAKCAA